MNFVFKYLADNTNPNSAAHKLRAKRFNLFKELLDITPERKILDVGGTVSMWIGSGLEGNVTILNITPPQLQQNGFQIVKGDACNMNMFKDKSFDIVFSNSVIEHVGNFERQKQFASEVQRVAKKFWVQTPYKHFPIEPHFLFPFFQYFPTVLQSYIGLKWKYSYFKRNSEDIAENLTRLRLLNVKDLNKLFPLANIFNEKYFGITKSIIAYKQ